MKFPIKSGIAILIQLAVSIPCIAQYQYTFPYDGTSIHGTWAEVAAFSEAKTSAYYTNYVIGCYWASPEPVPPRAAVGIWGGTYIASGATYSCTGTFSVEMYCSKNEMWSSAANKCLPIIPVNDPNDPPPPCSGEGNPIYPMMGSKSEPLETGLQIGRVSLRFNYDSRPRLTVTGAQSASVNVNSGVLGELWASNLHRSAWLQGNQTGILVARGNGNSINFQRNSGGTYSADARTNDRLIAISGGYRYADAATPALETYDATGKLMRVDYIDGKTLLFTYSTSSTPSSIAPQPGYLIEVLDNFGRTLGFQYEVAPDTTSVRLSKIVDTGGQPTIPAYDTNGNLIKMTWTDSTDLRFVYEATGLPWALTGVIDENAERYATFGYNSLGLAISTEHAGGVDKYSVTYATPPAISATDSYDTTAQVIYRQHSWQPPSGAVVTRPNGISSTVGTTSILGKTFVSVRSQPAGSGCNASTSATAYDANGNVASIDDFNGHRTCYANNLTRNLETARVEGLPNTQACSAVTAPNAAVPAPSRKTSTQWHPDWRLSIKVAEPGKLTTSVYNGQTDPFNANAIASCAPATALLPDGKPIAVLCRQVEQATTDADGHLGFSAALQAGVPKREQKWTYNQTGQVLTYDGPRTEVADLTTYTYYSNTTADHMPGDLQSVTNSEGQMTQFTRYNRYGQLLRSVDPNGVITTRSYDLHQRLLSVTVGGKATTYTYDPVGQLKRVTQPDASWIGYDYDAAHRWMAVTDNLGNRIDYTLDNLGNRTAEQVKDPSGTLKRALSLSLDALGRVQQTTGRE